MRINQPATKRIEDGATVVDGKTPQGGGGEETALVFIVHCFDPLDDSPMHKDNACVLALSLVNIALETKTR